MTGKELRAVLGKNIRIFRNRRSWSQAELAENAEISVNYLGDIERCIKWPHPDTLSKLAAALGIGVHELFMKESEDISLDTQVFISRFIADITLSLNKSLPASVTQSIENALEHYNIDLTPAPNATPPAKKANSHFPLNPQNQAKNREKNVNSSFAGITQKKLQNPPPPPV